jgi:hypothetical protein
MNQMADDMITINIPSPKSCEEVTPMDVFSDDETTPWVEHFKLLTEKLTESEDLVRYAIDAIKQSSSDHREDRPGEGIAKVFESHMRTRSELTRNLMEFVNKRRLK